MLFRSYGPLYVKDTIPAKSYPGQDAPNNIATVWNVLLADEKMSDQMAYDIVKTIFDKREDLIRAHKEAENIVLDIQRTEASSVPWHPGAIKYLAERGIKIAQ